MSRLHFVQRGAGEPLLLVQGLGGEVSHWGEPFLDRLARRFSVTAYDHRGIGASAGALDPAHPPFTITDLADDAAGLLDHLGLESAHVLGVSMGGMVAQELVLRHPERVRALVLACTFAGGATAIATYPPMVQVLAGPFLRGAAPPRALTDLVAAQARQWGVARDAAGVRTILGQLRAVGAHDTVDRLGAVRAPTLVVHGERDPVIPVANARIVADAIPGARLEILPRAGHVFFWEQPARSAQLVAEHALRPAGGS